MKLTSAVAALILFAGCRGFCQIQTAASTLGFEVASIKPSDPAATGTRIGVAPGGTFMAKNVTLKALIQQAYDVRDFQISAGAGWIDKQRYDIVAKGNLAGVSDDEMRAMTDEQRNAFKARLLLQLQMLLAERFQLKIHRENRELSVYALSVVRNGPKFKTATDDDVLRSSLSVRRGTADKAEITGTGVPLANLVRVLSDQVGRTVVDKTGLKGNYDFKITFIPDTPVIETDGLSIFTALEEQLGLRLEAQKGMVEVLVIDRAEKASEN